MLPSAICGVSNESNHLNTKNLTSPLEKGKRLAGKAGGPLSS
jgi:hypothetical protein